MRPSAETLLQTLARDHSSGAAELAQRTLADLALYLRSEPGAELGELNDLADKIKTSRPSMAPLTNAMTRWQAGMASQPPAEARAPICRHWRPGTRARLLGCWRTASKTASRVPGI